MLSWTLFALFGVLSYVCISIFGQYGGGSGISGVTAALATFKPFPFLVLVIGNIFWSAAIFYGLQNTRSAIPAVLALGVLTGFVYSIFFMGNTITTLKILGVFSILAGIYFLR